MTVKPMGFADGVDVEGIKDMEGGRRGVKKHPRGLDLSKWKNELPSLSVGGLAFSTVLAGLGSVADMLVN